jgi:hypothetical protein
LVEVELALRCVAQGLRLEAEAETGSETVTVAVAETEAEAEAGIEAEAGLGPEEVYEVPPCVLVYCYSLRLI